MLNKNFVQSIKTELEDLKTQGLYKQEYSITSSQAADIEILHDNQTKKLLIYVLITIWV